MRLTFIQNGKTEEAYLRQGMEIFEARIRHFLSYDSIVVPALKDTGNLSPEQQKRKEWTQMSPLLEKCDGRVLLDERGEQMSSREFAAFLQARMNAGVRNLGFVAGGPYGFAPEAYAAVPCRISLSKMTFSHQMVRLLFTEQLYRALTILKGLPYHND